MNAVAFYKINISRRGINIGGTIKMLLGFLFTVAMGDWRNNYVQVLAADGTLVCELRYGADMLGAIARKSLLDDELNQKTKEQFEQWIAAYVKDKGN